MREAVAVEAARVLGRRARPAFRTLSVHESRALLLYGIERRLPLQLVVGRARSGKSRLLGALSRTLVEGADLLLVSEVPETLDATLTMLADRLGVAANVGDSTVERIAQLSAVLVDRRDGGRLLALLVDDAHRLSPAAFHVLQGLAGSDTDGGALIPILLAGRPDLGALLEAPELERLRRVVATRIELLRPLPAEIRSGRPPQHAPAARRRPARAVRRWVVGSLGTAALGVIVASTVPTLRDAALRVTAVLATIAERRPDPSLSSPAADSVPATASRPRPVLTAPKPPTVSRAPRPLTAEGTRELLAAFAMAVDQRDLAALKRLIANDARQNGLRGRSEIVATYAYRFDRIDSPTTVGPPDRVVVHGNAAFATMPFTTAYRTAAGDVGSVDGTLDVRIVRRGGDLVFDSLDYAFAGAGG